MALAVLYKDGVGTANTVQCDSCLQQIDDDAYQQGQALHRLPRSARTGTLVLPVWVVHAGCVAAFVTRETNRGDRWFRADLPSLREPLVSWTAIEERT